MPLQDVSQDSSMLGWLRQSGHGHLIEGPQGTGNLVHSPSAPIIRDFPAGGIANFHRADLSPSFARADNYQSHSYGYQQSSANVINSPTQFLAPQMQQYQYDAEVEVKEQREIFIH
jgi:hypothetical protein